MKKTGTAIAVLILVVILGTLFGTHRSLSSLRQDTAQAFYQGVDNSGYGISTNLDLRVEYARNLCKVGGRYSVSQQVTAVEDACAALENAETPEEKYDANNGLTSAVSDLSDALAGQSLSQEDAQLRKSLTTDLSSFEMRIDKLASAYNTEVRSFNEDILGGFPAGLLGGLLGIDDLEEYA